jgi:hypothetical protein
MRCIVDTSDAFVHRLVVTDDKLLEISFGRSGIPLENTDNENKNSQNEKMSENEKDKQLLLKSYY